MPRIRTIKPEFPQSESMGRVSRDARLTFILLWTLADDSGRLRGNSRMLASLLYPYDDDAPKLIGGWLAELSAEGCIVMYASESDTYIQIAKWLIHQKIDKPSKSRFPEFDEASRILANPRESSPLDQGPRTKDQGPKDNPPKPPKGGGGVEDLFERVWSVYPRKVGKDAARKAFAKRRPSECMVSDMIIAIRLQAKSAQWLKDGGQYIPHMATWLHQGRWQDEPDEVGGSGANLNDIPQWRREQMARTAAFAGRAATQQARQVAAANIVDMTHEDTPDAPTLTSD